MGSQHLSKGSAPLPMRPAPQLSRSPAPASTPTSWRLWRPENGIVFGGLAKPASPSQSALLLRPSRPPTTFAQKTMARLMHTVAFASDGSHAASGQGGAGARGGAATEEGEDQVEAGAEQEGTGEGAEEGRPAATSLRYQIPEDVFRAARAASEGTAESFWSYTLYRHVQDSTRVRVHYSKSKHTSERVCREHFLGEPVLGFDLEWMMDAAKWQGPRRNVCLLQLASPSRIGLFHLSLYPAQDDLMAPTLRRILEDAGVIKAGVFIKGDATRLRNFLSVEMRGTFELSHLHRLVKYSRSGEVHLINKKLVSLADQVQEHLRLPLFKGQNVRAGDWSKPLHMDQIVYAASDAYAALQLFHVLEKQRERLEPTPPRPSFSELNRPIQLADGGTAVAADAEETADEPRPPQESGEAPLSAPFLDEAGKTLQIEADGDIEPGPGSGGAQAHATRSAPDGVPPPPGSTGAAAAKASSRSAAAPPKAADARIVAASEWQVQYCAGRRTVRARPASLRAYYIWHNDDGMDPASLAALLRQPPLQTHTVIGYILDAVRLEGLPYQKTRLRLELLDKLPHSLVWARYAGLARVCGCTP